MKKLLCIICVGIVFSCLVLCGGCLFKKANASQDSIYEKTADGKYIYFGEYPQTVKSSNVKIVDTISKEKGLYKGSDGATYYKFTINTNFEKTLYGNEDEFAMNNYNKFADGTSFYQGDTLYFKLEKIKWRIVKQEGKKTFIVCDNIINASDFQTYYGLYTEGVIDWKTVSIYYALDAEGKKQKYIANYYRYSNIEKFLNNSFYNQAFNSKQRQIILKSTIDCSMEWRDNYLGIDEREYVEGHYQDYSTSIFSLSEIELETYFSTDQNLWKASDFSVANGCTAIRESFTEDLPEEERDEYSKYIDSGVFWTRKVYNYTNTLNGGIGGNGQMQVLGVVERCPVDIISGIVPAMYIKL